MKNKQFPTAFKKVLITMGIICLIVFVLPWTLVLCAFWLSPSPPRPEIKYGEFPFKLVYEVNDKRIVTEDTLVIEYLGVGYNEGLGKYNKWNAYYKSSRVNPNDLTNNKSLELFNGFVEGEGSVIITFKLGSCEYYMGLAEVDPIYKFYGINPGDIVISSSKATRSITDEELNNSFNIKIIEKTISPPLL